MRYVSCQVGLDFVNNRGHKAGVTSFGIYAKRALARFHQQADVAAAECAIQRGGSSNQFDHCGSYTRTWKAQTSQMKCSADYPQDAIEILPLAA